MEKFTVYNFTGLWQWKSKGKQLKKMSLKTCFEKVFNTVFQDNMKQFFETNDFNFETKNLTVQDIFKIVEAGYMIIPFSVSVTKEEVLRYINTGFQILFMRAGEFNKMKKAYKDYI